MQLGFMTAILPDASLEEVFEFAAQTGYTCVEVMCWPPSDAERRYAGVTHIDCGEFTESQADDVNALGDKHGITIGALGYYPNPLSPHTEEAQTAIDHLPRVIAAAHKLGLQTVNTFIGRDWTKSVNENWPRMLEVWQPLVQAAAQCGVRIGIENCPMIFTDDEWPGGKNLASTPRIWERMFNDLDSPAIGLNYDPSHLAWMQMDYLQPIRDFSDRIFHTHAKDVLIDRRAFNEVGPLAYPLEYHTPKLPGLGEINWGRFVSTLASVGYDGPVCVEVEDRAFEESVDQCKAALVQSERFLRNFISG